MAQTLILDSEALNALARANQRPVVAQRARAILQIAHEEAALVRVPAPVLAEVCRGGRLDPVQRVLKDRGLVVIDLTSRIAQRAGALLGAARMSSAHAVDAFVVATALEFGSALIATGDPSDIGRLAADFDQLSVFAI